MLADVLLPCGCLWPLYYVADDVAIVADGIATFFVIVIVADGKATLGGN